MNMIRVIDKVVDGGPALKIPAHLTLGQHILDCLRGICERGESVALINGETREETSHQQLLQATVDAARGLRRRGVRPGAVVALCCENRAQYLVAALAALCCGATVTTLNLMYTREEILHVLKISKPQFIFCSELSLKEHLKTLKTIPSLKTIIQLNGTALDRSVVMFSSLPEPSDVRAFEAPKMEGSDGAFILYSSGTTGLPKGVMLSNLNVLYSVATFEGNDEKETLISIVPWYHAYGLMSTINYILVGSAIIYFSEGFNPVIYLKCIQDYKVKSLLTVPPIVVFLGKAPVVEQFDLSSVQTVWCGAAPLSSETIAAAMKRLPNCLGVFQAYGMTETSLTATKDISDEGFKRKPGCAGYPIPGVRIKVVDIDKRVKLGPYEHGEVCIKGPAIMHGYVGNTAATRAMFDSEGYLMTGDVGYYDEDGGFFIVDRLKELIKYKGYQVAPAEVESVLLQHSGVAECGVVGAPDEKAGELPLAFVVAKPGVNLTEKELLDFSAPKLSPTSQLRGGIIFVESIPKNPSGKILRRVLKLWLKNKRSKL